MTSSDQTHPAFMTELLSVMEHFVPSRRHRLKGSTSPPGWGPHRACRRCNRVLTVTEPRYWNDVRPRRTAPTTKGGTMNEERKAALDALARRYHGLRVTVEAVHQAVSGARQAGASWSEIADVLELPEVEVRATFGKEESG